MELVPIKVKIGLRVNKEADHPDWTKLIMVDSDEQVRQYAPYGWMYDKACGHNEMRSEGSQWDSPKGMQWGCLLVTRVFADEALMVLSTVVTELTEAEFEDFYNNKFQGYLPKNKHDISVLQGLKAEYDIKIILAEDATELKERMANAIDPNDIALGVRKNKRKTWSEFKTDTGTTVKT